jgi:hypothetical protein
LIARDGCDYLSKAFGTNQSEQAENPHRKQRRKCLHFSKVGLLSDPSQKVHEAWHGLELAAAKPERQN